MNVFTSVGVSVNNRAVVTKGTVLQVCLWNKETPILTLFRCELFNSIFCAAGNSTQGDGKAGGAVKAAWVWVTDEGGGKGGGGFAFPAKRRPRHYFISNSFLPQFDSILMPTSMWHE
jgi:hypothetical protein